VSCAGTSSVAAPACRHRFPADPAPIAGHLQVNLGYKCNQSCLHCHVNASPQRTEMMDGDTVALVLEVLRARRVGTLDLTGGAPELNPHFRRLVRQARARWACGSSTAAT
jgi:MoaA/NifB/PqqE/SkfB family radical SAM enzyme